MDDIRVEIHEPANVLSTMLLALAGGPKETKPHPIAADAMEHIRPFTGHPSIAWLREFVAWDDVVGLYGHAAQLAGPVSFVPRAFQIPESVRAYEPERMRGLPAKMAAFYGDARLGTFRRAHNADYALAEADVRDAIAGARIEAFLAELYGPIRYKLVAVPVPTHPLPGGATGAVCGAEDVVFLHPPRVAAESGDPVSWSLDPEAVQVLALRELSRPLLRDAMGDAKGLTLRLRDALAGLPEDAPLARAHPAPEARFAELFLRASSASYLRHTRGDEAAGRWIEDEARRTGAPLVRNLFLALESYLEEPRRSELSGFLWNLPAALRA